MHNDKLTAGGTPRTDGLPADMPLGTVYLLKFSGGNIEYEFVSAESYRQLEHELAAEKEAWERAEKKFESCMNRLDPSIEYVEGIAVGYGEDEIDRQRQRTEVAERRAEENERLLNDAQNLIESLARKVNLKLDDLDRASKLVFRIKVAAIDAARNKEGPNE